MALELDLRAVGGERARRYVGEGRGPTTSGTILGAGLVEGRDLTLVIHSDVRPWRGTFADGYDLACRVAGGLRAVGVQPGDPVVFQLPNRLEAAATFWAIVPGASGPHRPLLRAEGGRLYPRAVPGAGARDR